MQTQTERAAKVNTMSNQIQELRQQLYQLFGKYRGSQLAFCEQEGMTRQSMRRLLIGDINNDARLMRAADFIEAWAKRVKEEKAAQEKELIENLGNVIGNMASDEAPEIV